MNRHFAYYSIARVVFITAVTLSQASCIHPSRIVHVRDTHDDIVLNHELIIHPGLTSFRNIQYYESNIYGTISDSREPTLACYNTASSTLHKYYNKGRGPGEILSAYDDCIIKGTRQFVILDLQTKKLFISPLDAMNDGSFLETDAEVIDTKYPYIIVSLCSDGKSIYASGFFEDSRIVRLEDNKWSPVTTYSPQTKDSEIDKFVMQAYQCQLSYNEEHKAIVAACFHADQIEIINPSDGSVRFLKGPENIEPQYEVKADYGGTLAHLPKERIIYRDVKTEGDWIYVLYCGANIGKSLGCKEIRAISWDGKHLRRYILDRDVFSFDISDGHFYCATEDGDVVVYKYDR